MANEIFNSPNPVQYNMNNNILNIMFNNTEFRTVEDNGVTWFVASDIAHYLGYRDGYTMLRSILSDAESNPKIAATHKVCGRSSNGVEQIRDQLCISEFGIDLLCLRLRRNDVIQFRNHVLNIIYSVRHKGMYVEPAMLDQIVNSQDPNIAAAQARLYYEWQRSNELNNMLSEQIAQQQPLVNFANSIMDSGNTISLNELAKLIWNNYSEDIGRNRMMELMRKDGFLLLDNTPSQFSVSNGYLVLVYKDGNIPVSRVTPYGIQYFMNFYCHIDIMSPNYMRDHDSYRIMSQQFKIDSMGSLLNHLNTTYCPFNDIKSKFLTQQVELTDFKVKKPQMIVDVKKDKNSSN